jgi:hypothetical protein
MDGSGVVGGAEPVASVTVGPVGKGPAGPADAARAGAPKASMAIRPAAIPVIKTVTAAVIASRPSRQAGRRLAPVSAAINAFTCVTSVQARLAMLQSRRRWPWDLSNSAFVLAARVARRPGTPLKQP